jgi:tRNA A37 threonylcarbamoyltransferase TsaD
VLLGAHFFFFTLLSPHTIFLGGQLKEALDQAKVSVEEIDALAYTKGPGMGAPLV